MPEPDLFGRQPDHELSDGDLSNLFSKALLSGGGLPREASVALGMMAAEYLVDQLRLANLVVVERRWSA